VHQVIVKIWVENGYDIDVSPWQCHQHRLALLLLYLVYGNVDCLKTLNLASIRFFRLSVVTDE
jgi:hypothetical protein